MIETTTDAFDKRNLLVKYPQGKWNIPSCKLRSISTKLKRLS